MNKSGIGGNSGIRFEALSFPVEAAIMYIYIISEVAV
jgi:hypothetical protein